MSPVDALIVVAFVVYAVAVGLRNRRQASKNLEEYFLAGRSLPGWKAGLSMAATQFAADTPLLVTGLIATAGIFGLWQLWIFGVTFLVIGFVLAGAWRRAGVVTDAELTEVRYGATPAAVLRCGKALYFGTIINCVSLAWVLFAAAKIAEPFLLWHEWLPGALFEPLVGLVEVVGVPLTIGGLADPEVWVKTASNLLSLGMILAVVALYSATGGLRSVVATDIGQMAVMALGTLAFTTFVVSEAGGLGAMTARVHETFAGGGPGGILPDEILAFTPGRGKDVTLSVLSLLGLLLAHQLRLRRQRLPGPARDGLPKRSRRPDGRASSSPTRRSWCAACSGCRSASGCSSCSRPIRRSPPSSSRPIARRPTSGAWPSCCPPALRV